MSSLVYRPEIDGLRAVAVIPVVLFHLGFSFINGGYFGVDVFFVISGYLITSILLKENKLKTFTYKNFWIRRIRRILPALLVMIISILILSYFVVFRLHLKSYAEDALSSMFSYANFQMLFKFGDYWGQGAESSPFLHAWSLSVEEQFYILYPALITILIVKKVKPFLILLVLSIVSILLFFYCSVAYPQYGFYLLPARAWEMSCGGLLAVAVGHQVHPSLDKFKNIFPSIGIVLILLSYFIFTGEGGIGLSAMLPVLGSMLIIQFSSANEPLGKILGNNVIVWIGKISYSLYLWHWPIIVLSKEFWGRGSFDPNFYLTLVIIITFILSTASYYFVEKPTRKMKAILPFVSLLIGISVLIIFSFKYTGLIKPYVSEFNQTKFYGLYYDVSPAIKTVSKGNLAKREGIFAPVRDDKFVDAYNKEGIISGSGTSDPEIVVLGDSHGGMWGKVLDEIGNELNVKSSFLTIVGSNPLFSIPYKDPSVKRKSFSGAQWKSYCDGVVKNINEWSPKLLIISCKWSSMGDEDYSNLSDIIKLAKSTKTFVMLLNQPPIIDLIGDNNSSQYLSFLGFKRNSRDQFIRLMNNDLVESNNEKILKLSLQHENVGVINIHDLFKQNSTALIIRDNSILYYDDDHLSYQGTSVAKGLIKNEVANQLD